jgi:predicted esterase
VSSPESRTRPEPRLIATETPADAQGVVLVLHGGGGRGTTPVSPTQLSVLRMIPIAKRAARAGHGRLAVVRLLNAVRGVGADPLSNLRWALTQVRERHAGVPITLIGHSLGGSVALAGAGQDGVVGVTALAPWLAGSESVRQLVGRRTLIVHGDHDRVTSCRASEAYAAQARDAGAAVSFVRVEGGEHTMLRRMRAFDVLAAHFVDVTSRPDTRPADARGLRTALGRLAVAAATEPGDYRI